MWAAINDTRGERAVLTYRLMMQICKLVESVQELLHIGIVRVVNSRGFQRIDSKCCPLTNVEYWSASLASCCSCEQILVGVGVLGLVGVRGSMSRRVSKFRSIVEKE
ncbi:hypothetical protein TNIN_366901 [Trichonephila inaurata madagascariensis]|uniref:Uncharacterized protein n=1 Tax=Trichonephila inaurata madagascariensis TaxID=2747483 RepID=A0A8X6YI24_9ARAC|nr:hypothetical protein TNIN_366901 [Trichonephila inaurata madagascariensis]